MTLEKLDQILSRDGFVIFISGAKEKGKTDFACLLAEYCYLKGFRTKIATNIKTESYMIERQITDFPALNQWIQTSGKKLYILDEAGKSLKKLRFMSAMNLQVMEIIQLIRHYDAGFIGIAPSPAFIDSAFLNTDILDLHIKKLSKNVAIVRDYLDNSTYFLYAIPRTSINFNSKDIADFKMKPDTLLSEMPLCCQVATIYGSTGSYKNIMTAFKLKPEQVRRLLREHCQHSAITNHNKHDGIQKHEKEDEPLKDH